MNPQTEDYLGRLTLRVAGVFTTHEDFIESSVTPVTFQVPTSHEYLNAENGQVTIVKFKENFSYMFLLTMFLPFIMTKLLSKLPYKGQESFVVQKSEVE